MSKKGFLVLVGIVAALGVVSFIFFGGLGKKKAAVKLDAYPRAKVFIDGKEAGTTPYSNPSIASGEVSFKLVPEATFSAFWEKRITLNPATETVINWGFDSDPNFETGEVLYLEKTTLKDKSGLTVTCIPDGCSVTVDGQMRGFAPLTLEDVGEGAKKIVISLPGYKTKEITARAITNYRLVAEVKLAKEVATEEEISNEEEKTDDDKTIAVDEGDIERPYVLVKDTPTGWLRVRLEPSANATEAAKVDPGKKFSLLDEESGWYKIEYEKDKEGWISGRYAEKFE